MTAINATPLIGRANVPIAKDPDSTETDWLVPSEYLGSNEYNAPKHIQIKIRRNFRVIIIQYSIVLYSTAR